MWCCAGDAESPKVTELAKRRLLQFGSLITLLYAVLWGLQLLFKNNGLPATAALVAATVAGVFVVRPGWNCMPHRVDRSMLLVLAAIVASAAFASAFLVFLRIPTPYDKLQLNLAALMPLMLVFTGIEELLFRQVAYRWLEQGRLSDRAIVLTTAVAWGCGHVASVLTPAYTLFVLLQSLYLIWVGLLLGELRRRSGSWPVSWIGHTVYNATFLFVFALIG